MIQFSADAVNQTKFKRDPNWPVYTSLVAVYNAEKVMIMVMYIMLVMMMIMMTMMIFVL